MGWSLKKQPEGLAREAKSAVREMYRPVLRGYFSVYAAYYLVMLPLNWLTMSIGSEMLVLMIATAIAAGIGLFGSWQMRTSTSARSVERMLMVMNFTVVANVYIALNLEFRAEKLTYFIIMAMLFALASLNFRQSALSIAFAGLAMASFLPRLDGAALSAYAFLAFGAAVASLAIAFYLRKAITGIAAAKVEAEGQLEQARIVGEELRAKSLSDSLTQLPNRRAFFGTLKAGIRKATESIGAGGDRINVWLILVDLDGFKAVNDIHGHLTGDQLLKEVADRLRIFADEETFISRMGGDEFNIIVANSESPAQIMARCERLLQMIARPYVIEDRHVMISCSVGCTKMDLEQTSRSQISHADYALMVAKKQGKNRAVMFDEAHAEQADARFRIESELRNADLENEIDIVFQPQFRLGCETVARVEVLARWNNCAVGPIEPQRFIRVAEESGLITGITLVIVEKTLRELTSWDKPLPLSINLSGYDLISDPTIDQIIALVREFSVDPALIEFEVTETAMMADLEKATTNIERLTRIGFSIALDDFGTGYSNFNYLRSLPIKKLKVDKSFIQSPGDPMTEKILASLVGMARVLGVHCLLEGVEDEVGLLMAKRSGAELVQGYLLGKPMTSGDLAHFLRENDGGRYVAQAG